MTDKNIIVDSYIELDGSLEKAIEKLEGILGNIDLQYQSSVKIELTSDYESSSAYASVSYTRPMTASEEAVEAANKARYQEYIEKAQRQQYEALKAKFG